MRERRNAECGHTVIEDCDDEQVLIIYDSSSVETEEEKE